MRRIGFTAKIFGGRVIQGSNSIGTARLRHWKKEVKSKGGLWVILPLIAAVLASPLSAAETDLLQGNQTGFDVGVDRDDYKRTFTLENIPTNPKLQLDFKVVRKGRCPITYRATSIYINKQLLADIDFRKFTRHEARSVTLTIPPKTLRVGDNQLLIRTGWCQYDIDVLRLNNLVLVHE